MKAYKVDYISTLKLKGSSKFLQYQVAVDEIDLMQQLEALLNERHAQGYEMQQIIESTRQSEMGTQKAGLVVVFRQKEEA